MRVLVSAGWLGGAGGAERALHSVLRALSDDDVDVVVRRSLGGPLSKIPEGVRVHSLFGPRWWGASHTSGWKGAVLQGVVNPVRRRLQGRYDIYLQFYAGGNVSPAARARVRLLVPSGNAIQTELASRYDFIAMQAPDNVNFVSGGVKTVLLPPPVYDLSYNVDPPDVELPESYFLTVFNPYSSIKGMGEMEAVLDSIPHHLVWCHSQRTVELSIPPSLLGHPRVIHLDDPTPAHMRFLYEGCRAYLAFSRTEGFGWSSADALRYSRAVATRRIGLFSNPAAWGDGVVEVPEGRWHVDWDTLEAAATDPRSRDLTWMSAKAFRETLLDVLASHG